MNLLNVNKPHIIDDAQDYSNKGELTYTYEGDYYIQSYALTPEEIKLGKQLQEWHVHSDDINLMTESDLIRDDIVQPNHISLTPHIHEIRNVVTGTTKNWVWRPTEVWTANSQYPNSNDWPTVAWETSVSTTASKEVSYSVGMTDSVISSELGVVYTKSHTIGTSTTRTFKVPYNKDGRVKVDFERYYKTFTYVTIYSS